MPSYIIFVANFDGFIHDCTPDFYDACRVKRREKEN